jgi:pimeloyl-ACP methyl ester carboxylesterase
MELVEVDGVALNVKRYGPRPAKGSAPPVVVCIHGLVLDSLASFFLTLAGPLAKAGAACIMYDLRGHGRSTRPRHGYRLRDQVGDLIGLLNALGLQQPVHLIGNSFGGSIAMAAAAWRPERVASVVAVEGFPPTDAWAGRVQDLMRDGLTQLTGGDFSAQSLGRPELLIPRAVQEMRELWTSTAIVQEVPQRPWLHPRDLRAVTCPVLGIFGGDSELASSAGSLEQLLPGARSQVLPGYDHFVLVKARAAVSAQIVHWLSGVDSRIAVRASAGTANGRTSTS